MGWWSKLTGRPRPTTADDDRRVPGTAGGEAVDTACLRLHPDQPVDALARAGRLIAVPGDAEVRIYAASQPVPHWHYVTSGLRASGPSGPPSELTFSLADADASTLAEPPLWPVDLLATLGDVMASSGSSFRPGHYVDLNAPLAPGSRLTAVAFQPDPGLGDVRTRAGLLSFVQAVGLTGDELEVGSSWTMSRFCTLLSYLHPGGVTDASRTSVLADPSVHAQVAQGIAKDGSSSSVLHLDQVSIHREGADVVLTLGAKGALTLARVLPGRIPFGRELLVPGADMPVTFKPDASWSLQTDDAFAIIYLNAAEARGVAAALLPYRGDYRVSEVPGLVLRIVPSEITGADGSVEIIG